MNSVKQLGHELRLQLFRKFEYIPADSLSESQRVICDSLVSDGLLCLEAIENKGPCYYFAMPVFQPTSNRKVG